MELGEKVTISIAQFVQKLFLLPLDLSFKLFGKLICLIYKFPLSEVSAFCRFCQVDSSGPNAPSILLESVLVGVHPRHYLVAKPVRILEPLRQLLHSTPGLGCIGMACLQPPILILIHLPGEEWIRPHAVAYYDPFYFSEIAIS